MPTPDTTPTDELKGPQWLILGVLLVFGTLQLLRLLSIPATPVGFVLRSLIETPALYGILALCVAKRRPPFLRFLVIGFPLILLGHLVDAAVTIESMMVAPLLLGFAIGGCVATYWLQWRLKQQKST